MKKILMVATVPSMIGQFNIDNLRLLQELGYKVEVACNFEDRSVWTNERIHSFIQIMKRMQILTHQIDFPRNPSDVKHLLRAWRQMDQLVAKNGYAGMHCHTPVAAALTRIIAHKHKVRVVYTAHGFHFYRGASWKNWLIYYPVERMLSRWTDTLVTINQEDYELAKKRFHAKRTVYIQGVGIDVARFSHHMESETVCLLRKSLGIHKGDITILSVGELSIRKNHAQVIRALAHLNIPDVYYYIVGQGSQEELLNVAKEYHVEQRVRLLGFRTDIPELLHAMDLFVLPSLQEGLPVALMEALASGIPCLASRIRGSVDLERYGVQYFELDDQKQLENQLSDMISKLKRGVSGIDVAGSRTRCEDIMDLDRSMIGQKMRAIYKATY